MTAAIGVEADCPFSPGMLRKVVYAGAQSRSFVEASKDLAALAEVEVTAKRVERWTKRVGRQRVAEVEASAAAYQELPLPRRRTSPVDQIPQVACVMMDGGRIQIRDRKKALQDDDAKGYWRESLVGCCLSMTAAEHAEDPCPTIPQTFVDPARMSRLGREIKGVSSADQSLAAEVLDAAADRAGRPEPLVRSVVASREGIDAFGQRLVAAAHARGFSAARRQAFVADGQAANWSVHRKRSSHYTPILDFTHAVCYVWAAAMAGRSLADGWSDYRRWAQRLWEGATDALIDELAARSALLGSPGEADGETSPKKIVAEALGYLKNQRVRMNYAEYRQQGLPITSSHVESTIKQINRRVKGSEKFWNEGAEPLLQLAADHLGETRELDRFWAARPGRLKAIRCYQTAA